MISVGFAAGQREAGFADLAAALTTGCTVLEPVFSSAEELAATSPEEYVRQWLAGAGGTAGGGAHRSS